MLTVHHGIGISGIVFISVSLLFLLFNLGEHKTLLPTDRWLLLALCAYPAVIFFDVLFRNSGFNPKLLDYPFRFLFVIPIFLVLRRFNLSAKYLYAGIIFGAIGAGVFAIYQRYFLGIIQTKGFVFHISFGDISILLAFMSLAAWPLFSHSRFKKSAIFLILLAFSLGITGSILSTARGSWIAAPILFLLLINKYIANSILRMGISIVFISACVGLYQGSNSINTRVNLIASEIEDYYVDNSAATSVGARLEMWRAGWLMFKEKPWTGIGTGNYYQVSGELIKSGKMQPGAHYEHAHNDYISILAESGIPGLLSLLLLYGTTWYYFSSGFKQEKNIQNNTLALTGKLLIAGYATFSLTQANLNHQITIFFLAVMIAILAGLLNREAYDSTLNDIKQNI